MLLLIFASRTAACLGIMIVAVAATTASAADALIINPVVVTNPAGWKYKDGKSSDKITGKGVTPSLVSRLTNGYGIGIARFDGSNYYSFAPCFPLATKNNKSWSLKIKNTISMQYTAKNGSFTCSIWTQLPPAWVVYVGVLTNLYMVVDVSAGPTASSYPVAYLDSQPVLGDEYKTSKILLRRIPAGSFVMGAPESELGMDSGETQHTVTLTRDFYMGVFEITQAQYLNVMGENPSSFNQGAHAPMRPVEHVAWNTVRGGKWPGGSPAGSTFMYKLLAKTGRAFDLPTEAQWEYACRAGTTGAWNNGTTITNLLSDENLGILGRYWFNGGSNGWNGSDVDPVNGAHTTVGSYVVNQWDLYDMHGNVWEWCLDWESTYEGNVTDPSGAASGSQRVARSGCWSDNAVDCRSAIRGSAAPGITDYTLGFRLSLPAGR